MEITKEEAIEIREKFGTPVYLYDEKILQENAQNILNFPHTYGLTARYAMKANPNGTILRIFNQLGLHIDASSYHEVERALIAGIPAEKIQLTAQEIPEEKYLREMLKKGVIFNACSLQQLEIVGKVAPGSEISIRINPGEGSGKYNRTITGGSKSSFGIWHEDITKVKNIVNEYNLKIIGLHTHIGSGTDPEIWQTVAGISLPWAKEFPEVRKFNLGGGFKVARMPDEEGTDLQRCGNVIKQEFDKFYQETSRKLHLEIEPGTYLVANAGVILTSVKDIVSTDQYNFLKVDSGMTEIVRTTLYGAQHPLTLISLQENNSGKEKEYLVVGHCCETGDCLTPEKGNPENQVPRLLPKAQYDDLLIIGGAGAYCAGMSIKNYNSFPEAAEVLIPINRKPILIRQRQSLSQLTINEIIPEGY